MLVRLAVALGVIFILLASGDIADARGITSVPFEKLTPHGQLGELERAIWLGNEHMYALMVDWGWCGTVTGVVCTKPEDDVYGINGIQAIIHCVRDGNPIYCDAVRQSARKLYSVFLQRAHCDGNPDTASDRPLGPDLWFLALTPYFFEPEEAVQYLEVAEKMVECYLRDYPEPSAHVEALLSVRELQKREPMTAWDVSGRALGIITLGQALQRQHLVNYGEKMLTYLVEQHLRWNMLDRSSVCSFPSGAACQLQGLGRLRLVLKQLEGNNPFLKEAGRVVTQLLVNLASMPHGTTQRHVYRLMGLAASMDFSPEVRQQVIEGVGILIRCQNRDGGFFQCPGDVELSFVNSEAIQALYLAQLYLTEMYRQDGAI